MSCTIEQLKKLIMDRDEARERAGNLELYARSVRLSAEKAWKNAIAVSDALDAATEVHIDYDKDRGEWIGRLNSGLVFHFDIPVDTDHKDVMDLVDERLREIFDGFCEWTLDMEGPAGEDKA